MLFWHRMHRIYIYTSFRCTRTSTHKTSKQTSPCPLMRWQRLSPGLHACYRSTLPTEGHTVQMGTYSVDLGCLCLPCTGHMHEPTHQVLNQDFISLLETQFLQRRLSWTHNVRQAGSNSQTRPPLSASPASHHNLADQELSVPRVNSCKK